MNERETGVKLKAGKFIYMANAMTESAGSVELVETPVSSDLWQKGKVTRCT